MAFTINKSQLLLRVPRKTNSIWCWKFAAFKKWTRRRCSVIIYTLEEAASNVTNDPFVIASCPDVSRSATRALVSTPFPKINNSPPSNEATEERQTSSDMIKHSPARLWRSTGLHSNCYRIWIHLWFDHCNWRTWQKLSSSDQGYEKSIEAPLWGIRSEVGDSFCRR